MTTLAIIALAIAVFALIGLLAFGLCASASDADDQLVREGKLPWGS